ncbi:MAG: membrane protein insertase YidC [Vicinamibacterales bacterium]
MEKRVLLAVLLSFVVLYGYQSIFVKPKSVAPVTVSTVDSPPASDRSTSAPSSPSPSTLNAPAAAQPLPDAADAPLVADTLERTVTVDGPAIHAEFSTRGAILKSWTLKKYADGTGKAVELVSQAPSASIPPAFAVSVADDGTTRRLQTALFKPSASALQLSGSPSTDTLAFDYEEPSGLKARKVFSFGDAQQPYVLKVDASVWQQGQGLALTLHSGAGLGDVAAAPAQRSFFAPNYEVPSGGLMFRDGKVTRMAASSFAQTPNFNGQIAYIGIEDHYFLQLLLSPQIPVDVAFGASSEEVAARHVHFGVTFPATPASATYYFGPKQFETLAATNRELVRAINFGMFDVIVVPLLRALNWVNGYVGNYGWAIIILTILINGAMFPLRHKSVVSMRKLQQIQPEVKAIQDRYAHLKVTDEARAKMNTELMALYKAKGVNPASGCVPMLLTLPVLFAFYSMLSQAIELRGAPFVGWITDLSKHDPSYVTPILMGITMVWQQKITPSSADPVQQKVMLFMPVMFTFMFLWAPSGLVVYWLISNLWGIGQQYLTSAIVGGGPTPVPARSAGK